MEEKADFSIVVVDNASSANVRNYLTELEQRPDVSVVLNDVNYGFTYAVNQGIQVADPSTDIILLNNDALPVSGAFRLMSKMCNFREDAGAVVPAQVLEPGTPTMETHVPYAHKARMCDVNLSVHHDNLLEVPLFSDGEAYRVKFAPFFCVYLPRSTVNELGPLDAELGRHYRSDRLYSDKIIHWLGKSIYYLPDAVVIHKLQKSTEVLRQSGAPSDFDEMFRRNVWSDHQLKALDYRRRKWQ